MMSDGMERHISLEGRNAFLIREISLSLCFAVLGAQQIGQDMECMELG
jgi:hypothetical protein